MFKKSLLFKRVSTVLLKNLKKSLKKYLTFLFCSDRITTLSRKTEAVVEFSQYDIETDARTVVDRNRLGLLCIRKL